MNPDPLLVVAAGMAVAATTLSVVTTLLGRFVERARPTKDRTLDSRVLENIEDTLRQELGSGSSRPTTPTGPSKTSRSDTPAQIEALAIMTVYGRELVAEARRIAKRVGADEPSKTHVQKAAGRIGVLRDRAGFAADVAFGLGSILTGAALSYFLSLSTGGTAAAVPPVVAAIVLMIGAGSLGAGIVLKWRRS